MVEIPTTADFPDYRETVVLGGVLFRLRIVWNARSGSWHLDVSDASGNLIRAGLRLRTDWPCNAQHVASGMPDGLIVPTRLDGLRSEPGRADFPKLVALAFGARSELPAAE